MELENIVANTVYLKAREGTYSRMVIAMIIATFIANYQRLLTDYACRKIFIFTDG